MNEEGGKSLTGRIRRQLHWTRRSYPDTDYGWAFEARRVGNDGDAYVGIHTMGGEKMPLTKEMLIRLDEGHLDEDGALSLAGLILLGGVHPVLFQPVFEPGRRVPDGQQLVRRVGFWAGLRSPMEGSEERVIFEGRVTAADLETPLFVFSGNRPPGWPR